MLGTRPAELAPALDELVDSDLVHREPPESRADTFLFRHALIQEATYLGLLRAERRRLHAAAAAALEATSRDRLPEVAAVLGRYYAAAEDAERAVHYLEMAGDHATDAFANYEAISSFNAALAVARKDATMAADAVRLHAKLANVLWRIGRHDQAAAAFRAALQLGGSVDALQRAHLYTRLGRLELSDPQYEAAAAAFDAAEALLGDDPSGWDDATVDQWLEMMIDGRASIHSMRFEPDLLLATLERARPLLESRGTPARRHTFHRQVTMQELIRHRFRVGDADIARLRRSVELAEQTGDEKDVGYALYFLGWALWLRGDLTEAQQQLEKALAMGERIGETPPAGVQPAGAHPDGAAPARHGGGPRADPAGEDGGGKGRHLRRPHDGGSGLARLAGRASGRGDRAGRPDRGVRPRHAGHRRPLPLGLPVPADRRAAAVGRRRRRGRRRPGDSSTPPSSCSPTSSWRPSTPPSPPGTAARRRLAEERLAGALRLAHELHFF